ncbi:glycosyltransferase family 4 protein [Rhodoligotrophos defluvii]|uniref:glycosyltransferase family 4 protein n=1 Tax=Rhodoligotrophos defluvii TaxID=2561934 RepID=UPI0010C93C54|nr:glycosyltransferase family 4 protein [Rhodoligotrophos defluvii]
MKVAIVHDWLVVNGGAEKVLSELIEIYPSADLFSTVFFLDEKDRGFLKGITPRTTFIQRLPNARRGYRNYIALMPIAIEQLDMSGYDLVISSSYAVAKGVITGPNQLHVSYVHSSARYAWDLQSSYLREANLERGIRSALARWMLHKFRIWDVRTAHGVDHYIANSKFVARRLKKTYGVSAEVIHPPVDLAKFTPLGQKEKFYLAASRLVPYKRIPLIAEAFSSMPDRQLVIIGDGPDMDAVRAKSQGNVRVLGYQPDDVLRDFMRKAKAFVFAAEEDFGIMPLEAQACATPVIAYGRGGALETVVAGKTGILFPNQSVEEIRRAVEEFEHKGVSASTEEFRQHVERFSRASFRENIKASIDRAFSLIDSPGMNRT